MNRLHGEILLPTFTLAWREVVRFYRQRSRILSAVLSPLILWLVIGSGLSHITQSNLAPGGYGYLEYFFPGTILMVLLFTAIFSTISLIEDRREGFLQSVMVAPVSRSSIVLGRIIGASALAVLQGALFLILAPFIGIAIHPMTIVMSIAVMAFISFGLAGLGFLVAWRLDSIQGFHAIMNLLMMPMWVLSGAVFPGGTSGSWTGWVVKLNPLSYGLSLLRRALYLGRSVGTETLPPVSLAVSIVMLFGTILFFLCLGEVRRRRAAN